MTATAVARLGGLDTLVISAGAAGSTPTGATPLPEFRRILDGNLLAVLGHQVALPHLLLEEVQSSQLRRYTVCRAARAIRLLRRKVRGDRHGACHGTRPGRPKRLNPLQLRTLTLLQALPQERAFANPPEPDGTVSIHTLPHAHGDRFHIGPAVLSVRDAIGLDNPNVLNALARKGLLLATRSGLPVLTAEGLAYDTGIAPEILHGDDH